MNIWDTPTQKSSCSGVASMADHKYRSHESEQPATGTRILHDQGRSPEAGQRAPGGDAELTIPMRTRFFTSADVSG
jgi:hypothetical protein